MADQEKRYRIELTQKQLMELLWWHDSDVEKWRKKGVKDPYLTLHENNTLRQYIERSLLKIKKLNEDTEPVNKIQSLLTQIASARMEESHKEAGKR